MQQRQMVGSGTEWEELFGYSRAVRVGNIVEVAGTTAVDERGAVIGIDDPFAQTSYILSKIERALAALGASLSDVVRTRMFVVDIQQSSEIGRAHGLVFGEIKPVATMVEVRALIDPQLLVEIEVTAILPE
ncbi:MAG: RidA family protein [Chloroflexi bacterium]|nr:RidA family protein [Chloroflexota bacterium]